MKTTRIGGGVILGLGLVVALATTVAGQDVKIDWDKSTDFAKYKSFSAKVATPWGNPLGEKRALDEVEKAIVARGWTKADEASADAVVLINGATEKKRDLNTFYSGYGGYRYGGMGSSSTTVTEFTVGTMVVDIFDAKTKQLIWRGIGTDELSDKADKNYKKIVNATEDMFKKFPPVPGAK